MMMPLIPWLFCTILLAMTCSVHGQIYQRMTEEIVNSWPTKPTDRQEAAEQLLNFDAVEKKLQRRLHEAGVLEVAPVAIPYGDGLHGGNWFFGWPVAAGKGDVIVVVFQRSPYHYGGANPYREPDQYTSSAVMVRSEDGGRTWSEQIDLKRFIQGPPTISPGGMRAIKVLQDGRLMYIGDIGLLISRDMGKTWTHHPDAFKTPRPEGTGNNLGPTIIEHPTLGLLLPGHAWRSHILEEMWFWQSRDGGATWHRVEVPLSIPARLGEPAGIHYNGRLILIGRSHDPENFEPETQTYRYAQVVSELNSLELSTAFTNIRTSHAAKALIGLVDEHKSEAFGYWSQDTVDIILNPVTGRIEVVATNRTGRGGPNVNDITHQSLNLWSIDPEALVRGSTEWRFEGTLLERPTLDAPKFFDGMHPACSVLDEQRGVQHIFIYSGYYAGPAGIFRITRTLDTDRLSRELQSARADASTPESVAP